MSKFEWTELERLSNEIAHAQSRFDAARATKNYGLSKLLEQEITDLASRRAQVLANITKGLGAAAPARWNSSPTPLQSSASGQTQGSQETQSDQEKQVLLSSDEEPPGSKANKVTKEGDALMWDELTRADIERFNGSLLLAVPSCWPAMQRN